MPRGTFELDHGKLSYHRTYYVPRYSPRLHSVLGLHIGTHGLGTWSCAESLSLGTYKVLETRQHQGGPLEVTEMLFDQRLTEKPLAEENPLLSYC